MIASQQPEWLPSKHLQIGNAGEGVKRKEPSYTVGRKVNWCSPDGAQYGGSLKKLKIELTYNSAIPLLSTGLKRNTVRRDHMYRNVHCSTVYNSQDMEATYLPIDREMDKKRGDMYIQRDITQPCKRMKQCQTKFTQYH